MKHKSTAIYLSMLLLAMAVGGCKVLKKEQEAAKSTDESRLGLPLRASKLQYECNYHADSLV